MQGRGQRRPSLRICQICRGNKLAAWGNHQCCAVSQLYPEGITWLSLSHASKRSSHTRTSSKDLLSLLINMLNGNNIQRSYGVIILPCDGYYVKNYLLTLQCGSQYQQCGVYRYISQCAALLWHDAWHLLQNNLTINLIVCWDLNKLSEHHGICRFKKYMKTSPRKDADVAMAGDLNNQVLVTQTLRGNVFW